MQHKMGFLSESKGKKVFPSISSRSTFFLQPPLCPFLLASLSGSEPKYAGQEWCMCGCVFGGGLVLRTNKDVQHLIVRDVPIKGKKLGTQPRWKQKQGPQPVIGTCTKLHQRQSEQKNGAEKGIKLPFLCFGVFNKGSSLILSWIFISVSSLPILNEY